MGGGEDRWLVELVGGLVHLEGAGSIGRRLVHAAADVTGARAARMTCRLAAPGQAGCERAWTHPADAEGASGPWSAVPIAGHADGELAVLGPIDRPARERLAVIAGLAGAVLGSTVALEELAAQERRFRVLVEQLPLAIYIDALDDGATSMYNNPANEVITGCSDQEWKDDPHLFSKLLHPEDRDRVLQLFADARLSHEPVSTEYRIVRPDGTQVWVRDEAVVVHDETGAPEHIQGYLLDITRRRTAEDELARLAFEDPVTGLPNRRRFDERFELQLSEAAESGESFGVVFVDLDNFKQVNDRYGHDAGDVLLRAAAGALRTTLRDRDFLARLGGDEFVALIPGLPPTRHEATAAATAIVSRLLEAVAQDVVDGGRRIAIGASIGVAIWPHDAQAGGSLLRQADTSMYRAKQAGRNRFQLAG